MSTYLNRQEEDNRYVQRQFQQQSQGFRSDYRQISGISQQEGRRLNNQRPNDSIRLGGGFISAISNVSGGSDDGFKNKYFTALRQLNNLLKANENIRKQLLFTQNQLMDLSAHQPQSSLINSEMEQLRQINQKLENEIKGIFEANREWQEEIQYHKNQKENLRKELQKVHELSWKLDSKEQEIHSIKDGFERQLHNLNDTVNKLQVANSAFKAQESNLKEMYGGKEESNIKKISYLQSQLQQTKSQLTKEREKINTEIQGMSMRIRKQTQSELINYKLEMTKLKDSNIELQRQNERLTKQVRELSDRRTDKKSSEQRHVHELQENVQNCKKEIRRLKQNLSNTHNTEIQKQSLQKEVKVLQQQMHLLTEQSTEAKARSTLYHNSNETLMSTNARLEAEIEKMRIDKQKLEGELKRKETVINRHKSQSDTLKAKVIKYQSEVKNETTRGNFSELQDKIRQLKNKANLLSEGKYVFEEDQEEMEKERLETFNSLTATLEEKISILTKENEEVSKRLHHYKDKCTVVQKKFDSSSNQIKVLSTKIQKYQSFVPKLEFQLERAIKQSQYPQPVSTNQYLNPSENLLKDKVKQMNDRLVLEAKYAKQQLETKCLEYDSKLVSAKLQISKLKGALKEQSFFHNRITDLSQKLSDSENRRLELTKKVGDLERQKALAERLPVSLQKQLQTNKSTMTSTNREVEELRLLLIEKDREIARAKTSYQFSKPSDFDLERQELVNQISNLEFQNSLLVKTQQESEIKKSYLQKELERIKQSTHSDFSGSFSTPQQLQKIKEENSMLRQFEKSYFQLEEKSAIIISSFEDFKVKYEQLKLKNDELNNKYQILTIENNGSKTQQQEYESKIESMSQMFDVIYKRLQQSLYQNTELLNQNNRLKGISTTEVVPSLPHSKIMSAEEKIFVEDYSLGHADSAPEQNETARFETKEELKQKGYKKQFETALFGSNSDNSYEMEFKADYGEYY